MSTLPFTDQQFLDVFGAYNGALWPVVAAFWVVSLAAVVRLFRGGVPGRLLMGLTAVQWIWVGIAYHAAYFAPVNPAAWTFAGLFLIEGLGFLWVSIVLPRRVKLRRNRRDAIAGVLLVYALAYPAVVALTGVTAPRAPIFAVPCPLTMFTAGVLIARDSQAPKILYAIPIIWSIIGGSAAALLGMTADIGLAVAGAVLVIVAVLRTPVPARFAETAG